MKDLGPTKRILGMDINRDRIKGILMLSQIGYIKKVFELYDILDAKFVNTLMEAYFKLKSILHDIFVGILLSLIVE